MDFIVVGALIAVLLGVFYSGGFLRRMWRGEDLTGTDWLIMIVVLFLYFTG